jgi:hypothetical protein
MLFLSDFNETSLFSKDFEKYSNIKFHENPFSGSRTVPRDRMDGRFEGQTDMERLVSLGNFATAPKNQFTVTPKHHISRVTAKLDGICSITQNFQFLVFQDQE